jgi:dUTP pyrophosphatase
MSKLQINFIGEHKPSLGSIQAAGYDIYISKMEQKGKMVHIETDLAIELPPPNKLHLIDGQIISFEYEASLLPRSGIASKGWILGNCEGLIDADYRGKISAFFWQVSDLDFPYVVGDRFAQLVFSFALRADFFKVNKLSETVRNINGYGHTGNK